MSSAALLCGIATAQSAGYIEGVVLNSITGSGIEGVEVTMFTRDAVRYTATTDPAGGFSLSGMAPGSYQARLEKVGYFTGPPAETAYRVGPGVDPPHPRLYITRDVSIRGRVVDPKGEPAANVNVSFRAGAGVKTGSDGTFEVKPVPPGVYTLLATPLPTDREVQPIVTSSRRIVVRDQDVEQVEIRLQEAEVFRIRGTVLGPTGDPVPKARVHLHPIVQREPSSGSGTIFSISGTYRSAGAEEANQLSNEQGEFEFFPVRPGDWLLQADTAARIDSPDLVTSLRAGVEEVHLGRGDIDGVRIRLQTPFEFTARDVRVTSAFSNSIAFGLPQAAGRTVMPGTYFLTPAPRLGRYATSVTLDGRDVLGQPVALINGSQRIEVQYEEARGSVRGKVTGEAGTVVLIPAQLNGVTYGYTPHLETDGTFSLSGIAPGDYNAAAITGYDRRRGLTLDAGLLRRIATLGTRVRIAQDGAATVELRPMEWLE